MFNGVEYIREVCRERKIPISILESECGFANGYLNPKKLKKIPYDRAVIIANYLDLSVDYILTGQETEKTPTPESERKISMDDFTYAMSQETKNLPQEKKDMLLQMARFMAAEEQEKMKKGE